ncbi:MAG TPA: tripartite tricarboxylate transporter TctB family protein [Burkholderiales bacterium]|jgi:hypothetical protein
MAEGREGRRALGQRSAEIGMAVLFLATGAVVVYDSVRLGIGWADDGPRAGYFPFYVGLLICVAAVVNGVRALLVGRDKTFVEVGQLKLVLTVLVPTAVYVAVVGWIGIYVSSAVLIGLFMRWLGKYAWWKVLAVSVGTTVALFLVFELWFQVPLPKGPLEDALGLG